MNDGDRVSTSPFSPSPFSAFIHSSFRSGKWKRNKSPSANDLSSAAPTDRPIQERCGENLGSERRREGFWDLGAEFPVQWVLLHCKITNMHAMGKVFLTYLEAMDL